MVASYRSNLLADFSERGLIHEVSAGLDERVAKDPAIAAYIGFDPSADSLHVGHLKGVLALRRLQLSGGRPIALVGGGTGMIGDPSGRSAERNLLDRATLDANRAAIGAQLARLLDFSGASGALLLDNLEWLGGLGMIDFLRDTGDGIHVSIGCDRGLLPHDGRSERGQRFGDLEHADDKRERDALLPKN